MRSSALEKKLNVCFFFRNFYNGKIDVHWVHSPSVSFSLSVARLWHSMARQFVFSPTKNMWSTFIELNSLAKFGFTFFFIYASSTIYNIYFAPVLRIIFGENLYLFCSSLITLSKASVCFNCCILCSVFCLQWKCCWINFGFSGFILFRLPLFVFAQIACTVKEQFVYNDNVDVII